VSGSSQLTIGFWFTPNFLPEGYFSVLRISQTENSAYDSVRNFKT